MFPTDMRRTKGNERLGYRRLYRSRGCTLGGRDSLDLTFPVGEVDVEVHIGPKPKLGLMVGQHSEKYIVPGEDAVIAKGTFHSDATKVSEAVSFFSEIRCTRLVEVQGELSERFRARDGAAQEELLNEAGRLKPSFREAADLVAGVIGLRFHRQFVLELIDENAFVERGPDDHPMRLVGPSLEILDLVSLREEGVLQLEALLSSIGQAPAEGRQRAAVALQWLVRAWEERDPVSKFLSLFIPLECVLEGIGGDPEKERVMANQTTALLRLIESAGKDQGELSAFVKHLDQSARPSLNERFERLAKEAGLPGWEEDVRAFRRFNAGRNKLLHNGNSSIELSLGGEQGFDAERQYLEDLAERYVCRVFFGDAAVYASRWRPKRPDGEVSP